MTVIAIHDRYGVILTIVAAVGAVLAVVALLRPPLLPMVRSYAWLLVAATAVQGVIGLVLVLTGHRPGQLIHWFYGVATLIAIPLAVFIGASQREREPLWLMGGVLATLLFAFRAITTG